LQDDLITLSSRLAPRAEALRAAARETAINTLYCWLVAQNLEDGQPLHTLPVHTSADVSAGIDVIHGFAGGYAAPEFVVRDWAVNPQTGEFRCRHLGRVVRVRPGDYLLLDKSRALIRTRRLIERPERLAAGLRSAVPMTAADEWPQGRLYINLAVADWAAFFGELITRLDGAEMAYEIKWFVPAEATRRVDPTILYFGLPRWRAILGAVAASLAETGASPRRGTPALTLELSEGVAFATTPHGFSSFGRLTATVAYEAIRDMTAENSSGMGASLDSKLRSHDRVPPRAYCTAREYAGFELGSIGLPRPAVTKSETPSIDRGSRLTLTLGMGALARGAPGLVVPWTDPTPGSGALSEHRTATDLYAGTAGHLLAAAHEELTAFTAAPPEADIDSCWPVDSRFAHGYLSGTLGSVLALAETDVEHLDIDRLSAMLEHVTTNDRTSIDASSGLAGSLMALVGIIRACGSGGGKLLDHAAAWAQLLVELSKRHSLPGGFAHGSLGVVWALFVASVATEDRNLRQRALDLLDTNEGSGAYFRWCDGAITSVVTSALIRQTRIDWTSVERELTHSLAESEPPFDGTLCHGLGGSLALLAYASEAEFSEAGEAVVRRHREWISAIDAVDIRCRVGDGPSAGLFDGPLGLAYALVISSSGVRRRGPSPLLPGYIPSASSLPKPKSGTSSSEGTPAK